MELAILSLDHGTLLGDNGVDVLVGSDIETRVPDTDPLVSNRHSDRLGGVDRAIGVNNSAADLSQLLTLALLDLDLIASQGVNVDAGGRGGNHELDAVVLGEDSKLVRSDLVGSVTVANNTVGTNDNRGDVHIGLAQTEQSGGHAVGKQGGRNTLMGKLESSQTAALVIRAGLSAVGVSEEALVTEGTDDTESGAMAGGGERAGVAVGDDSDLAVVGDLVLLLKPLGTECTNGLVGLEILGQNLLRGLDESLDDDLLGLGVRETLSLDVANRLLEQLDGVAKINGSWPRLIEVVQTAIDVLDDLLGASSGAAAVVKLNGRSQSSNNGNGGSTCGLLLVHMSLYVPMCWLYKLTSDSHSPDAVKGLLAGGDLIVVVLMRESKLVQDLQLAAGVLDGFEGRHDVDFEMGEAWGL